MAQRASKRQRRSHHSAAITCAAVTSPLVSVSSFRLSAQDVLLPSSVPSTNPLEEAAAEASPFTIDDVAAWLEEDDFAEAADAAEDGLQGDAGGIGDSPQAPLQQVGGNGDDDGSSEQMQGLEGRAAADIGRGIGRGQEGAGGAMAAAAAFADNSNDDDDDAPDAEAMALAESMLAGADAGRRASAAGRAPDVLPTTISQSPFQTSRGDSSPLQGGQGADGSVQPAHSEMTRPQQDQIAPAEEPSAYGVPQQAVPPSEGSGPQAPSAPAPGSPAAVGGGGAAAGAQVAVAGDLDPSEVVLRVQVCRPKGDPRRSQEFLVLGSQPLTDLRDRIVCATDSVARIYLPDKPAPSGFFYVEGVFFNDMRDPEAVDLSEPLRTFPHPLLVRRGMEVEHGRAWIVRSEEAAGEVPRAEEAVPVNGQLCITFAGEEAAAGAEGAAAEAGGERDGSGGAVATAVGSSAQSRFRAALMEAASFEDLSICLGAAYCYCHQGTCEHILRVTELRRLRPEDRQMRAAYPVQTFWDRPRLKVCGVCQVNAAQKTVYRSRLAPSSPCALCGECFQRLHYDAQGRLLFSDFEVFDHIENTL